MIMLQQNQYTRAARQWRGLGVGFFIALLLVLSTACEKFLDVEPKGIVIPESESEYRAMLTNVYNGFPRDLGKLCLRTDDVRIIEFKDETNRLFFFDMYTWNDDSPAIGSVQCQWKGYYHAIFIANYMIENLGGKKGKNFMQMAGEAYLLRAYAHFILANMYAPAYSEETLSAPAVPLALDTDTEKLRSRATVEEVYNSVKADIEKGMQLMNVDQWKEPAQRYRFSKDGALAFQCRLALYMGQYQECIAAGEQLLARGYTLCNIVKKPSESPLLFSSTECIQAMDYTLTEDMLTFVKLSEALSNLYEDGDKRKTVYYDSPSLNVYAPKRDPKKLNETSRTFSFAEVYLNLAEAYTRSNQADRAKEMLKKLMASRLSKKLLTARTAQLDAVSTEDELIPIVLNARRRELAFSGHRWFDLRRTGQPAITHTLEKPEKQEYFLSAKDTRYTLPIPREARDSNPNL